MDLEQTLQDKRLFWVFSLAVMTLTKSARLLLERGADPLAITHINRGIELISVQLSEAAQRLENEVEANHEIDALCQLLGLPRPDPPPEDSPPSV